MCVFIKGIPDVGGQLPLVYIDEISKNPFDDTKDEKNTKRKNAED